MAFLGRRPATTPDAKFGSRKMKWFFLLALGLFVASSYYATQIVPNIHKPPVSSWASYMGSSHCFPCLEASFWTSEFMAFRIAGSGTMLDSYLEPPSFTEESRWPHQGRSRKTCPALSDKQSIPTHGYAARRKAAMAAFAKSWQRE